jgi:hypothetical protein
MGLGLEAAERAIQEKHGGSEHRGDGDQGEDGDREDGGGGGERAHTGSDREGRAGFPRWLWAPGAFGGALDAFSAAILQVRLNLAGLQLDAGSMPTRLAWGVRGVGGSGTRVRV